MRWWRTTRLSWLTLIPKRGLSRAKASPAFLHPARFAQKSVFWWIIYLFICLFIYLFIYLLFLKNWVIDDEFFFQKIGAWTHSEGTCNPCPIFLKSSWPVQSRPYWSSTTTFYLLASSARHSSEVWCFYFLFIFIYFCALNTSLNVSYFSYHLCAYLPNLFFFLSLSLSLCLIFSPASHQSSLAKAMRIPSGTDVLDGRSAFIGLCHLDWGHLPSGDYEHTLNKISLANATTRLSNLHTHPFKSEDHIAQGGRWLLQI